MTQTAYHDTTDTQPAPIEPHEQLIWDVEAHMDRYRKYRDTRNVQAMRKAFTAARMAHEALGDELDRIAEADDVAAEAKVA